MTVVLKLGGSVITQKDRPATPELDALDDLADEIAAAGVEDLVVVHGGGSFGHYFADRHDVSDEEGSADPDAATEIHDAMKGLNELVVRKLRDRDLPAVSVHPFSAAHRDSEGTLHLPTDQFAAMLGEGFVPVTHGDVVTHSGKGVTILSGDEIVVELAEALDADRVGLCSAVPGVYDADDEVLPRIESFDEVADVLGGSDATDVTGGMAGKVKQLLGLAAPAHVFDVDGVGPFLAGDSPGTRID